MLSAVLVIVSAVMIARSGHDRFAWLGVLVANATLPVFFAWLMFGKRARSSEYQPFLLMVSASGSLLVAWEVFEEGSAGWPLLLPAILGTALFAMYEFWYSRFSRVPSESLSVGRKMPPFELRATDGALFHSAELAGSPAILIFYRGNWCPLCMAQIREVADRYRELEALGVRVVLISSQDARQTGQLAAHYGLSFRFLVDESNRLADDLGISVQNGVPVGLPGGYGPDTVMPTVVVLNASGTIVYSDQTDNYRVRPEPDIYIAILRRAGAISR